jgi:hypothetical protein
VGRGRREVRRKEVEAAKCGFLEAWRGIDGVGVDEELALRSHTVHRLSKMLTVVRDRDLRGTDISNSSLM